MHDCHTHEVQEEGDGIVVGFDKIGLTQHPFLA